MITKAKCWETANHQARTSHRRFPSSVVADRRSRFELRNRSQPTVETSFSFRYTMKGSFICPPNPIQLHGVGQISIPSNSRKLKRSIYTDQNHCFAISGRPPSALSIHHSQFACLRATHRQAAGNNLKGLLYLWERLGEGFGSKAKKETPVPIYRKQSRKGFRGQLLKAGVDLLERQLFYIQICRPCWSRNRQ